MGDNIILCGLSALEYIVQIQCVWVDCPASGYIVPGQYVEQLLSYGAS